MSTTKKCKRCIYDKVIYKVDYEFSARRQLIFYYEIKICSKCNHYSRDSYNLKRAELDNYPKDMIIDLSKIIPNKKEAVSKLTPFPGISFALIESIKYVKERITGTITTIPKKPYTTDGIPASKSTAGFSTL